MPRNLTLNTQEKHMYSILSYGLETTHAEIGKYILNFFAQLYFDNLIMALKYWKVNEFVKHVKNIET